MTEQNSFNYQFKNDLSELNFFVNETNFYAFSGIIKNNFNKNFLYGPKKSGKTFIGKIWQKQNSAIQLDKNFNTIVNNKNNILIDNLTSFDQEQVFHIINNCTLNNNNILIISDKKINEIDFIFDDLSSRLKTFDNFEIDQPNDEMLLAILTKLLTEKQFIIKTKEIFEYIMRRVDRSYYGVYDVVKKLDILSLEKKRQLTIPLIKEIL